MGGKPGPRAGAGALFSLLALMGCVAAPAPKPVAAPQPEVSADSAAMEQYYRKVQAGLLSDGLLRTDRGGPDTPFDARLLARNFLRVAFYEEYAGGGAVRHAAPVPLTRWNVPVRVALSFGESVPEAVRGADTARFSSYLALLSRLTGWPIGLAASRANFTVFIANVDERRLLGPELKRLLPDLTVPQMRSMTHPDNSTYCQVVTETDPATSVYTAAVAVIPSEQPELIFLTCLDEELAQGLGLPNDYGRARPSIFNDDQEFALLTRQDELMLKMLYNPALKPGMTESEARPIVEALATQLMGDKTLP